MRLCLPHTLRLLTAHLLRPSIVLGISLTLAISGCRGSSGSSNEDEPLLGAAEPQVLADLSNDMLFAPTPPRLRLTVDPGQINFYWSLSEVAWSPEEGIAFQRIYLQDASSGEEVALGEPLPANAESWRWPIALNTLGATDSSFRLELCDHIGECISSRRVKLADHLSAGWINQPIGPQGSGATALATDDSGRLLFTTESDNDTVKTWFRAVREWSRADDMESVGLSTTLDYAQNAEVLAVALWSADGTAMLSFHERLGEGWFEVHRLPSPMPLDRTQPFQLLIDDDAERALWRVNDVGGQAHLIDIRRDVLGWTVAATRPLSDPQSAVTADTNLNTVVWSDCSLLDQCRLLSAERDQRGTLTVESSIALSDVFAPHRLELRLSATADTLLVGSLRASGAEHATTHLQSYTREVAVPLSQPGDWLLQAGLELPNALKADSALVLDGDRSLQHLVFGSREGGLYRIQRRQGGFGTPDTIHLDAPLVAGTSVLVSGDGQVLMLFTEDEQGRTLSTL